MNPPTMESLNTPASPQTVSASPEWFGQDITGERVAVTTAAPYRAYRSRLSDRAAATSWVQIDLGAAQSIHAVKVYPSNKFLAPGNGFPSRFRVECDADEAFSHPTMIADRSQNDYPDPLDCVVTFSTEGLTARFVRLTAVQLRQEKPLDVALPFPRAGVAQYVLSLTRIEILSDGRNVALERPVCVDAILGNAEDAWRLTRPPRPQGEGVWTDHPDNVTPAESWRPPVSLLSSPTHGVSLNGGLFRKAMDHNIAYLLESFTIDDLLRPFRMRAGKPVPESTRARHPFWEDDLAGSNAGRFLMGAGNTLRFIEHATLRERMNAIVAGIAECREPDGYIMGFPQDSLFVSEHGAYTRVWTTLGLIEAGRAGAPGAFDLLRGYYDGYNRLPFLPELLRRCNQGGQGMVANSQLYFTPVGAPNDIQTLQRYFQENYWLEALARRDPTAIEDYPYDRPHAYLLTNVLSYLDLFRATGERRYLEAVDGAWDLFHDHWQNVGGAISIVELMRCPPNSHKLYDRLGETCASAFWVMLNQQLHALRPAQEKYVSEIEKSLYNVLFANQDGAHGIRYHTMLLGHKEPAARINTCCEGQGTRLFGRLPEYIYSIADDGLYVNLFEPSSIEWHRGNVTLRMTQRTDFPRDPAVELVVNTESPQRTKVWIRVPSWTQATVRFDVNGREAANGSPGSFTSIERVWADGDTISFNIPLALRLTRYTGADQAVGYGRFALEYGPLLMAALDAADSKLLLLGTNDPGDFVGQLRADPANGGHFIFDGVFSAVRFIPYFEVTDQSFSCFPLIEARGDIP